MDWTNTRKEADSDKKKNNNKLNEKQISVKQD